MIQIKDAVYGVRVKLNSNFQEKCLGDRYLKDEKTIFIRESKPFNDSKGYCVFLMGGSLTNNGYAYLDEIDLDEADLNRDIPDRPLYILYN